MYTVKYLKKDNFPNSEFDTIREAVEFAAARSKEDGAMGLWNEGGVAGVFIDGLGYSTMLITAEDVLEQNFTRWLNNFCDWKLSWWHELNESERAALLDLYWEQLLGEE